MSPDSIGVRVGLRRSKHKLTRPRQAVFDVITRAHRHLTPAEIYRRARTRYAPLGLTTVYRTLDLFEELGYIQRIHLEEGCHSYAAAARPHGHHLVCTECGRAEVFVDGSLERSILSLNAKTGYTIDAYMVELMGLCPTCQSKGQGKKHATDRRQPLPAS
jgi:Fe2+ or Zn2+ uptake regulation protein